MIDHVANYILFTFYILQYELILFNIKKSKKGFSAYLPIKLACD
nr:MAG TPA: hypothetical protein [Caudoviricetes sp.]